MTVAYSVTLYDGSLSYLARLPVVAVDAGQVVNDVADAQVEVVSRKGLLLDDVAAVGVTRHEAGRVMPIGLYFVQTATEKWDNYKRTWAIKGASPLVLYTQRLGPNLGAALTNAATLIAMKLFDGAWRYGDTPLTVEQTRADLACPTATTQVGVLEPLAAVKAAARAAETAYGMDMRFKVNYDLTAVPTTGGLILRPVAWTGEYGADRRVRSGIDPVLLYLSRVAHSWQAVDDRSRQVTRLVGTGSASSYANTRAMENPYGNRREKTVSASSGGASRVNSQARATLYEGRPVTGIQADLVLPPDRYGLGLGDVFTVNVGGQPGTAWLNVIHYAWNSQGEKVAGRIDVEVQKWT